MSNFVQTVVLLLKSYFRKISWNDLEVHQNDFMETPYPSKYCPEQFNG